MSTVRAAVKRWVDRSGPDLLGVACSGGVDSVVLADAVIAVAGAARVAVLVIDHGMQEGSAEAAERVRAWAKARGAMAEVRAVRVEGSGSREEAARDARYEALADMCDELGITWCFVGHTMRDQAETVMMRIVRGTGPAGLAGMREVRGRFVRPLLHIPRAVIEACGEAIWDDPMNRDLRFARVRMRERVMPMLREENPAIEEALVRLADATQEWRDAIDTLAEPFARLPVACAELAKQPAAVAKRALALALEREGIAYDAVHLDDLLRIVRRDDAGTVEVPGGRLVRVYGELRTTGSPVAPPTLAPTPGYELRAWREGDRMRPARLKGRSKKLSDLYVDAKVPREARRHAQVMVRIADGTIVWAEHIGPAFGETIEPAR